MLDFSLPIKIVNRKKDYPSFFVKEVLFHNHEYALVKVDMEDKDLEYSGEHGDIVTIALPTHYSHYSENKVLSSFFTDHKAENGLKDKNNLIEDYREIFKNKKLSINEKQKILIEIVAELGYPNIRVVISRDFLGNTDDRYIQLIRDYEDIGYIYKSDDFTKYIEITDNFIAQNHNQIFPICEVFKENDLYRKPYELISRSNVYINTKHKKFEVKITDSYGNNPLYITKEMNLNRKEVEQDSPVIHHIEGYTEFKKLLVNLHETLYNKVEHKSEW